MNYLDLFSGIGGFRLGAEWTGLEFENEFHSDIDNYANKVYAKHFPDSIPLGDITKIKSEDLLKYGKEWIITGGFPCQDISIAGKGAGITGERSGLWFEYWRLIRDLRPRFAIVENVGMLVHRGLREVLGSLAEIGYNAEWQDIRAEDMGAPHRRERIWIVAYPVNSANNSIGEKKREKEKIQGKHREKRCSRMPIRANNDSKFLANAGSVRWNGWDSEENGRIKESRINQEIGSKNREFIKMGQKDNRHLQWEGTPKPEYVRVVNGIPNQLDRIKCLGNSIVPQIAYLLFNNLKQKGLLN